MIFVVGKTGCGKTTLLNLLAGLDEPTEGKILFHGKDIAEMTTKEREEYRNNSCGFVFQNYNLIEGLSAGENVALSLELQGKRDREEQVKNALRSVGLEGYENRRISELSGGQRQRIAIARATVKNPEIIFADEPTGALDEETSGEIFDLLKEISKKSLVVVVSHDSLAATKYADGVIRLSDGKIVANDLPSVPPKTNVNTNGKPVYERHRLSAKTIFRLSSDGFFTHPFKRLSLCVLCAFLFTVCGFLLSFLMNDENTIAAKYMKDEGTAFAAIRKVNDENGVCLLTNEDVEEIKRRSGVEPIGIVNTDVTVNPYQENDLPLFFSVKPFGFAYISFSALSCFNGKMIGRFPADEKEVMLTSYTARYFDYVSGVRSGDGEAMLGETILLDGEKFTVSGIFDSGFREEDFTSLKGIFTTENSEIPADSVDLYYSFYHAIGSATPHHFIYFAETPETAERGYTSALLRTDDLSFTVLSELISFSFDRFSFRMNCKEATESLNLYDSVNGFQSFFQCLILILGLFTFLLLLYFFNFNSDEKIVSSAVLIASGLSVRELRKILSAENFIWGAVASALASISLLIVCKIANTMISGGIAGTVFLFRFQPLFSLSFLLLTVVCLAIEAFYSPRKICFGRLLKWMEEDL